MDAVDIVRFTPGDDDARYQAHRRLKLQVFALEYGWAIPRSPGSDLAGEDPFDPVSLFLNAESARAGTVGTLRATPLAAGFPHEDYLAHHLGAERCTLPRSALATINSVAVARPWRGMPARPRGRPAALTVGKALMWELCRWLRERGLEAAMFTTIAASPAYFFHRLGAYLIDPPLYRQEWGIPTLNFGLVMDDRARFEALGSPLAGGCAAQPSDAAGRCRDYFRSREDLSLHPYGLRKTIEDALASEQAAALFKTSRASPFKHLEP